MALAVALKILDPRLMGWGFPHYGSSLAAGLDLHASIDEPLVLRPQAPAVVISAGDRIAQLVFTRIARAEFKIVTSFGEAGGRQEGGFGSTGIASACPNRAARRQS